MSLEKDVRRHLATQPLGLGGRVCQTLTAKVPHITFPGGRYLRSPLLVLGMLWHKLKELT
ncbi:hypothetical protein AB7M29_004179 [Pseudomonas sp. F-14 TE3623]